MRSKYSAPIKAIVGIRTAYARPLGTPLPKD